MSGCDGFLLIEAPDVELVDGLDTGNLAHAGISHQGKIPQKV